MSGLILSRRNFFKTLGATTLVRGASVVPVDQVTALIHAPPEPGLAAIRARFTLDVVGTVMFEEVPRVPGGDLGFLAGGEVMPIFDFNVPGDSIIYPPTPLGVDGLMGLPSSSEFIFEAMCDPDLRRIFVNRDVFSFQIYGGAADDTAVLLKGEAYILEFSQRSGGT